MATIILRVQPTITVALRGTAVAPPVTVRVGSPTLSLATIVAGAAGGGVQGGTQLGAGADVFRDLSGDYLRFRSITAGDGIAVTQSDNEIEIAADGLVAGATQLGAGADVYRDQVGDSLRFRSLTAGDGVLLDENDDDIEIAAALSDTAPTDITDGAASAGNSDEIPRRNHVHRLVPSVFRKVRATAEGVLNVLEYSNVDHTGVSDSHVGLQNAIDDIMRQTEVFQPLGTSPRDRYKLFLPSGVYNHSDALVAQAMMGGMISGAGMWQTKLRAITGMAGKHMLRLRNARNFRIQDLHFDSDIAAASAIYLQTDDQAGDAYLSTMGYFRRVQIFGYSKLVNGILVDNAAGAGDILNDQHVFEQCIIYDCTEAAWKSATGQQKDSVFRDCHFVGNSPRGVYVQGQSGSIRWENGFMYGCSVACFDLNSPIDPCSIIGGDFESNARWLISGVDTANGWALTMRTNRWTSDALHADGVAVSLGPAGPYDIVGNQIGWFNAARPRVELLNTGPSRINLDGNEFESQDSYGLDPLILPASHQCIVTGTNTYRTGGVARTMAFRENEIGVNKAVRAVTTSQAVRDTDYTLLVDATGGARTITLLSPVGRTGRIYNVKKTDASANAVTIDGNGATIDGAATKAITTRYQSYTVQSDGTAWSIL